MNLKQRHLVLIVMVCNILWPAFAAIEEKFKGERREDAVPFAERTHDLFADAHFSALDDRWGLLHRIPGEAQPIELQLREIAGQVNALMSGIRHYSQHVVVIAESPRSDSAKVDALADYLQDKSQRLALALGYSDEQYAPVILQVRRQDKLRDALRVAQPLFDAADELMKSRLSEMERLIGENEKHYGQILNAHYSNVLRLQQKIAERKKPLLQQWSQQLPVKLSASELNEVQQLNALQNLINDDYERLLQARQIISRNEADLRQEVNQVRSMMSIWVRAHAKMSKGIYHPAEWFEIDELPKKLVKKIGL